VLSLNIACGASRAKLDPPVPSDHSSLGDAGSPAAVAPQQPPPERPFAKTPLEAQTMIQEQITARMNTLWKCVEDYRVASGDPHKAIVIDVGIDQEGQLLGVATANPKAGTLAPSLRDCVMRALRAARFPRSHAGVIAVRQSFQDAAVRR